MKVHVVLQALPSLQAQRERLWLSYVLEYIERKTLWNPAEQRAGLPDTDKEGTG